jgi:DNA (cytosine-5)-methyltransferase 1
LTLKKDLSVVSLFSGCGGMDLGFEGDFNVISKSVNKNIHPSWIKSENEEWSSLEPTRFKTIFANDIKESSQTAWETFFYKRGIDNNVFHLDSIVNIVKETKKGNSALPNKADLVTGGFPCQDFSNAGRRLGFNSHKDHTGNLNEKDTPNIESRGMLYHWMKQVIEIIKPKMFIAENVKGMVSLPVVKKTIENDFRSIDESGYILINPEVLNASEFGVPQNRERIFFIGLLKTALKEDILDHYENSRRILKKYNPYPQITHRSSQNTFLNKLIPYTKTKEILQGLPEPEDAEDVSQQYYSKAKWLTKGQGQKEIDLEGVAPTIRAEHHGNIEFRRLTKEHGGKHFEELNAGLHERRLTIRECARLQTFPDDYQFVIRKKEKNRFVLSPSKSYKLIGNAVPPLLAYNIAKKIELIWDDIFS